MLLLDYLGVIRRFIQNKWSKTNRRNQLIGIIYITKLYPVMQGDLNMRHGLGQRKFFGRK